MQGQSLALAPAAAQDARTFSVHHRLVRRQALPSAALQANVPSQATFSQSSEGASSILGGRRSFYAALAVFTPKGTPGQHLKLARVASTFRLKILLPEQQPKESNPISPRPFHLSFACNSAHSCPLPGYSFGCYSSRDTVAAGGHEAIAPAHSSKPICVSHCRTPEVLKPAEFPQAESARPFNQLPRHSRRGGTAQLKAA